MTQKAELEFRLAACCQLSKAMWKRDTQWKMWGKKKEEQSWCQVLKGLSVSQTPHLGSASCCQKTLCDGPLAVSSEALWAAKAFVAPKRMVCGIKNAARVNFRETIFIAKLLIYTWLGEELLLKLIRNQPSPFGRKSEQEGSELVLCTIHNHNSSEVVQ